MAKITDFGLSKFYNQQLTSINEDKNTDFENNNLCI